MKARRRSRAIRDTYTGSNPLPASAPVIDNGEPAVVEPVYKPLTFDTAEFMQFVEGEDMTEAEATELLRAIWMIGVAWVDLAFGLHPIQQIVDDSTDASGVSGRLARDLLSSSLYIEPTNTKTDADARRAAEAKEDS